MKMGMDLSHRQTFQLKLQLAPRMIQSMEILQLPIAELQARIEKELQENPVLELRDSNPDMEAADTAPPEFNADSPLKHDMNDNGAELEFKRLEALDKDWGGVFNEEEHRPSRGSMDELGDKKMDAMQNLLERPQSLQDYLAEQLSDLEITDDDRTVAMHIISMLDRTGYVARRNEKDEFLPISLLEIASTIDPPVSQERIEEVLSLVQDLDPPGVGARDLRECLTLQIQGDTPHRELVRQLIHDHMEDIAHNRLPAIAKKTGADLDTIREAIDCIKHFNPKPGAQYSTESTRYVTPDVIIEKTEEGEYEIRLTDDWAPRLNIPKRYYSMYKDRENTPETRDYLKKKLQSAEWLRDAIEQRRNTLMRVTRAIIDHQKEFLNEGPDAIRPLKMQEIADLVKVHVTTVSRAVDDKWIQTPRGVFPLKRFFVGAATNKETGEQIPWEKVKKALLDMVGNEDKANPLSDEELEEKLTAAGFPVKRRTVTKYRKLLSIASSRERKEHAPA
ncbi:RNA polymerase factor sigma-54 [Zavarzinella formosa]|uniref:RNA polymerase factor sigma-54 n=1 Tax=Zavarzinella formosa TaxID=360055 RepID=UPI0002E669FB|nr:RNA polymerase factor sigma-54 [Zavarzinella formosa]